MRLTPYQALRNLGAPDGLLTVLPSLLIVLALSPWLDIEISGIVVKESVPAWVAVVSGTIFLVLLIPFLPLQIRNETAQEELQHRLKFIRRHIARDSALVSDAVQVIRAIDGQGGEFRPSQHDFDGIPIEAISNQAGLASLVPYVEAVREESRNVPRSHNYRQELEDPTKTKFQDAVNGLLRTAAQQGALPDARTSRR